MFNWEKLNGTPLLSIIHWSIRYKLSDMGFPMGGVVNLLGGYQSYIFINLKRPRKLIKSRFVWSAHCKCDVRMCYVT